MPCARQIAACLFDKGGDKSDIHKVVAGVRDKRPAIAKAKQERQRQLTTAMLMRAGLLRLMVAKTSPSATKGHGLIEYLV